MIFDSPVGSIDQQFGLYQIAFVLVKLFLCSVHH